MADTVTNVLAENEVAQRKMLVTVAEWDDSRYGGEKSTKEILGVRTEDSAIELNPDIQTTTDILGITYTEVNKTEPSQSFDPHYVRGGSKLGTYLSRAFLKNDIAAYSNNFTLYIVTMYLRTTGETVDAAGKCYTVRHEHCSIIPQSAGGDAKVNIPIEVHYSNEITEGTVTVTEGGKLSATTFEFTEGLTGI